MEIPKEIKEFLLKGKDSKIQIEPLADGANNKAFKLTVENKNYLLKNYYNDSKERGARDFYFSNFIWNSKIKKIPKPFLITNDKNFALFEFCKGRKLNELNEKDVNFAIDFIVEINKSKESLENIKDAVESCFTIDEHINLIKKRVSRISKIEINSDIDKKASEFVNRDLIKFTDKIIANIKRRKFRNNKSQKILSPSDFGFHNSLKKEDGELCFFDFEYAGFDDSIKLICDFFCQPEVPVPHKYIDTFILKVESFLNKEEELKEKVASLFPLYQIKWCCIMLNEFLHSDLARRKFSKNMDINQKKEEQLAKAKQAFLKMESMYE